MGYWRQESGGAKSMSTITRWQDAFEVADGLCSLDIIKLQRLQACTGIDRTVMLASSWFRGHRCVHIAAPASLGMKQGSGPSVCPLIVQLRKTLPLACLSSALAHRSRGISLSIGLPGHLRFGGAPPVHQLPGKQALQQPRARCSHHQWPL